MYSLLMGFAEADLRCGEFLSEKSCRQKLVVSTSFFFVSSVFISFTQRPFFGLSMRCGYADGSGF